ncbi:hypothetical protein B0T21DRAFT_125618 [Apiosordaria backusii]|uniref:Uncharacterized protein n=1 Tax=Apiosordaria backusii TaxID=314023 RepID=A0AA40EMT4_9PEZI|nr:hypothetical protein B0T21DRAFT_125618 [Apiosordaria backusii]
MPFRPQASILPFLLLLPLISFRFDQPIAKLPHANSDMQRRACRHLATEAISWTRHTPCLSFSMYDLPPAVTNNRSFRGVQDPPNYLQNPLDGWSKICFSTAREEVGYRNEVAA